MDFQGYSPYLTINGFSRHSESNPAMVRNEAVSSSGVSYSESPTGNGWNEQNQGFGIIGKKVDGNVVKSLGIGQYLNSLGDNSVYGTIGRQFRLLGGPDAHLDIGGRAGLVTGYDLPVVPMIQPTLSLGGKNFDINLGYQPKIKGLTPEVFMLNADYRLK